MPLLGVRVREGLRPQCVLVLGQPRQSWHEEALVVTAPPDHLAHLGVLVADPIHQDVEAVVKLPHAAGVPATQDPDRFAAHTDDLEVLSDGGDGQPWC